LGGLGGGGALGWGAGWGGWGVGGGTTGAHPFWPQALAVPFLCHSRVLGPSHPIRKGMGVHYFFIIFSLCTGRTFSLSSPGTRDCIHRISRKGMRVLNYPCALASVAVQTVPFLCHSHVRGVITVQSGKGWEYLCSAPCVGSAVPTESKHRGLHTIITG
jgi:hypothetical protein